MKTPLLTAAVLGIATLCSGCVAYPVYDGPGYYGSAVVVAPVPVVVYHGYYGYRGYGRGYGHGYGYGHGPYRHW